MVIVAVTQFVEIFALVILRNCHAIGQYEVEHVGCGWLGVLQLNTCPRLAAFAAGDRIDVDGVSKTRDVGHIHMVVDDLVRLNDINFLQGDITFRRKNLYKVHALLPCGIWLIVKGEWAVIYTFSWSLEFYESTQWVGYIPVHLIVGKTYILDIHSVWTALVTNYDSVGNA